MRDRERKMCRGSRQRENLTGVNGNVWRTEKIVPNSEKFKIEGVPDIECPLFVKFRVFSPFSPSNTLPQYPGWINLRKFPGGNEAYKISPRWTRFGFSTSPVCIGNLSHSEKNFELLMLPSEFLKFWHFPGDIAQTVFSPWLAALVLKVIQAALQWSVSSELF